MRHKLDAKKEITMEDFSLIRLFKKLFTIHPKFGEYELFTEGGVWAVLGNIGSKSWQY